MGETWPIFTVFLSCVLLYVGTLRYLISYVHKVDHASEKRADKGIAEVKGSVGELHERLDKLKDDLHRDYVRREEHENFLTSINESLRLIYERTDSMSREVNQLIGEIRGAKHGD